MNERLKQTTITIAGLGLMGGSLALALRESVARIFGIDVDEGVLKRAREQNIVDQAAKPVNSQAILAETDVLVLSMPIRNMTSFIETIKPHIKTGLIVTDVGSEKSNLANSLIKILPESVRFCPGHPMTGSEISGLRGARRDLFKDSTWILCDDAPIILTKMISAVGATPLRLEPDCHDYLIAHSSHLPYIMSVVTAAVGGIAAAESSDFRSVVAGGFRDTTRVSGGDALLGTDMCLFNEDNLTPALEDAIDCLMQIRNHLKEGNAETLERFFSDISVRRNEIVGDTRATDCQ